MIAPSEQIKFAFNKAAPLYHQFDSIQKLVGATLIKQTPNHIFHRVIDLGCGAGWTTQYLAQKIQAHHCHAIDFSEAMIAEAKKHYGESLIQFTVASFDTLEKNYYDLVFSNMALHWSEDFYATLKIIYRALQSKGYFVFSVPLPGTFEELRSNVSVRFFLSYQKILNFLMKLNFRIIHSHVLHESLMFDSTLDMQRSLKKTGATVCQQSTINFKQTRSFIRENIVKKLSYRVGIFIVEKCE